MSKSVFFFDIDNTLLYKNEIPKSTLESLNLLKEKGHYIYICTGRPEILIKGILKLFDFDGCIVSNGGACYINTTQQFELYLDNNKVEEVIKEVLRNSDTYSLLTTTNIVTYDPTNEMFINYLGNFPMMEKCDRNYHLEKNIKSFVIHPKDLSIYTNKFNEEEFLEVNKYGYELLSKEYSKGTACKYIIEKLNVDSSYGFGDEVNDLSMFSSVDISVAMGNACDELKSIATYQTKNVWEDGIQYALKNILKVI
ncbi:MAG: Cof-type HAD-IIB family hydrolase [bacterium]